jgi:hypothetical protein
MISAQAFLALTHWSTPKIEKTYLVEIGDSHAESWKADLYPGDCNLPEP